MKIGILTFHAQQNYGGVLQCFAMRKILEQMGHEVVVVDRWPSSGQRALKGVLLTRDLKALMRYALRALCGCGDSALFVRAIRSVKFVTSLGLTKYHFHEWKEAPKDLGLDCLLVGSDQVWRCGDWAHPSAYLLEGAPKVKAISYAASFGMKEIPAEYLGLYARGLSRFDAISCREREGVEICRRLGFPATHVADPTLLAEKSVWDELIGVRCPSSNVQKKLVCYFMSVNVKDVISQLEEFAKKNNCRVEVLADTPWLKEFPKSLRELAACRWNSYPHVKIAAGYGPKEFVRAMSSATWTLTDSFHAVMFSTIFGLNLRFIKPQDEIRRSMFSRIEEFVTKYIRGPVFVDSVQSALESFAHLQVISYNHAEIQSFRSASKAWLRDALDE